MLQVGVPPWHRWAMLLPITLTAAAGSALLSLWLGSRTVRLRLANKVLVGDGGHPLLIARMRAQANFVEYAPFVLILLGLVEAAGGTAGWLWLVAAIFLLGRVLHPFGMDRQSANPFRAIGILSTWAVLLVLAGYALWLVYAAPVGPVVTSV